MTSSRLRKSLALLVVSGFLLTACGGGGSETAQSNVQGPVSVLGWTPPANYADNAALDPLRDLDHYELYVRQDNNFIDNDLPVALIAAVTDDSGTRVMEKEFILENVQSFIPSGNRHYVSLKAVGIDGQKSHFMAPVTWDRI